MGLLQDISYYWTKHLGEYRSYYCLAKAR